MFLVGLADKYAVPPSRLKREWGSRDITDLQAFYRIQNRENRMQAARAKARTAKTKPRQQKPQSPEEMLRLIDGK